MGYGPLGIVVDAGLSLTFLRYSRLGPSSTGLHRLNSPDANAGGLKKPRGANSVGLISLVTEPPRRLRQTRLWSYEAGIKSKWLDNRLRFNIARFISEYDDIQVNVQSSIIARRARIAPGGQPQSS